MKTDDVDFSFKSDVPTNAEFLVYYSLKNPIAFPEIFIKEKGNPITLRYYQYLPCLSDNIVLVGGRKQGKSWDLENRILQNLFSKPYKETLFTTLLQVHLVPRMNAVYDKAMSDDILKELIKSKRRGAPYYTIESKMRHIAKGIIAGENKKGDNVLSSHVDEKLIDESQCYSPEAYLKLQQASAEGSEGAIERLYGVPDNRADTPFSNAIQDESRTIIRTPAWCNPFYSLKENEKNIIAYKGTKTPEYRSNVEALESEVAGGAWDYSDIMKCFKRDIKGQLIPAKIFEFDKEDVIKNTVDGKVNIQEMLKLVPRFDNAGVFVGHDVGKRVHPSVIIPFVTVDDNGTMKYKMECRINLLNISYPVQEQIVDYLMDYWGVSYWGLDTTGNDGEGILDHLHNTNAYAVEKDYLNRIVGINFRESLPIGIEKDDAGNVKYENTGEVKMLKAEGKVVISEILFEMFRNQEFVLPNDPEIGIEFSSETRKKSGQFNYIYHSVCADHTIDAFRCFGGLMFKKLKRGQIQAENQKQNFTTTFIDVDF